VKRKDHPFWPHHVIEQIILALLIIGAILTLAVLLPAGLAEKADPVTTPEHVKPEWYFLAVYQVLKLIPRTIGIVGMILVSMILPFFPFFFDRNPEARRPKKRLVFFLIGIITLVWFITFTIWGHFS
jgi:quinol-cytochrome oxidoreductase complex cytochrome b subunit